ncbi:Vacuolar membrane-associated protein IML1 [Smittium mucronatum]|uniref:Vacuolar membrane-associated protein IML1 n=1 Tax=Smittium mucronatum TaxID=133383 RepID=A0A1R0GVW6_9FUNG|nr:Vacuolar membrane-associated protein IML1 [Smittium mucronatum]
MMDSDTRLLNEQENVSLDSMALKPDVSRKVYFEVGEIRTDVGQLQIDSGCPSSLHKIGVDFVEITIKDQYSLRCDLYRLWKTLEGKPLHQGQLINLNNILKASVKRMFKGDKVVSSGYVSSNTKPIFRSESAKVIILLQLSAETREFEDDGELMSSKIISFLVELFSRWENYRINHIVSVILFSRVTYDSKEAEILKNLQWLPHLDSHFCDYYKVLIDMESRNNWLNTIPLISKEIKKYFKDILEVQLPSQMRMVLGKISRARYGNILEAINLSVNSLASGFNNRDLLRSGQSIMVVTPSNGIFNVPRKLLRITTERLLKMGQHVDLVCLSRYPLFQPPVFCYKGPIVPSEKELLLLMKKQESNKKVSENPKFPPKFPIFTQNDNPILSLNNKKNAGSELLRFSIPENSKKIDPNSLDPLYYDEEKWNAFFECDHELSEKPKDNFDNGIHIFNTPEYLNSKEFLISSIDSGTMNPNIDVFPGKSYICNAKTSTVPLDYPDKIKDQAKGGVWFHSKEIFVQNSDNIGRIEVTYCFYPSWIECGFYSVGIDNQNEISIFQPRFKMGKLNNTGVADFMKKLPEIEDIDLHTFGLPGGFKNFTRKNFDSKNTINDEMLNMIAQSCDSQDNKINDRFLSKESTKLKIPKENSLSNLQKSNAPYPSHLHSPGSDFLDFNKEDNKPDTHNTSENKIPLSNFYSNSFYESQFPENRTKFLYIHESNKYSLNNGKETQEKEFLDPKELIQRNFPNLKSLTDQESSFNTAENFEHKSELEKNAHRRHSFDHQLNQTSLPQNNPVSSDFEKDLTRNSKNNLSHEIPFFDHHKLNKMNESLSAGLRIVDGHKGIRPSLFSKKSYRVDKKTNLSESYHQSHGSDPNTQKGIYSINPSLISSSEFVGHKGTSKTSPHGFKSEFSKYHMNRQQFNELSFSRELSSRIPTDFAPSSMPLGFFDSNTKNIATLDSSSEFKTFDSLSSRRMRYRKFGSANKKTELHSHINQNNIKQYIQDSNIKAKPLVSALGNSF